MPKDFFLLSTSTLSPLAYSGFIYLFCERTMSKLCKVWGQPEASQVDRPLCYQFCHWFCTNSCSEKNARLMCQSKPPTPHPLSRNGKKKKKGRDEKGSVCTVFGSAFKSSFFCTAFGSVFKGFHAEFWVSSHSAVRQTVASIFMPSFWHNVKLHYQCVYTTRLRFWH